MTGKAQNELSIGDFIKNYNLFVAKSHAENRNRRSPLSVTIPLFGSSPSSSTIGVSGNFLPVSGGSMIGPIALLDRQVLIDINNNIDISSLSLNPTTNQSVYTSNILFNLIASASTQLDTIQGNAFGGQVLFVKGPGLPQIITQNISLSIDSIVGNGTDNIITVTLATGTGSVLATNNKVNITGTTTFDILGVTITKTGTDTFTYDLGSIGSATPDTNGQVLRGNIQTQDGKDIVVTGADTFQSWILIFDNNLSNGTTQGLWRVVAGTTPLGGGVGVSFPIDFPEEPRGNVGGSTEAIDFTQSDRHAVIMTLTGDIGISLTNSTSTKLQISTIKLKQDGTGGHAFTGFSQTVANEQAIIDAVDAANGPNEFVVFVVRFLDGLFTAFLEDSNVIGSGGTSPPFSDTLNIIKNFADQSKLLKFDLSGFTTATTRTMTMPNADTILAGLGVVSQTWTGTNIFAGNTTVRDTNFFIQQTSDITKQLKFDLVGATTGKVLTLKTNHSDNRIITLPDNTTTLAGLNIGQTWTGLNKFNGGAEVRTTNFKITDITDITKVGVFNFAGATTNKVLTLVSNHSDNRTLTFPNTTTTLAGLGVTSQTWTGTNIFAGNTTIRDTNFFIQQTSDITKQLKFDLLGATTGKILTLANAITDNRTLTFPNTTTTLAGLGVTSQTWTGTNIFAGNVTVRDTNFFIQQTSDITKQLKFDLLGATTGKVVTLDFNHTDNRTLTFPDITTTLAGLAGTQTFTGSKTFNSVAVLSGGFFIENTTDPTKQLRFLLAGATTGKVMSFQSSHTDNRTLTFPDSTTSLAGLGVVSQSWTGTNDFFGITKFKTNNSFVMQDPNDPTKQVIWDLSSVSSSTTRTITMPDTDINLGAGGSGEANTASNLGVTTFGLFAQKNGIDLEFKSLIAGTNITLSQTATGVTINSTGGVDLLPLANTWTGINTFTNQVNLNSTVVLGDQTTDLIQGVGRLARDWDPDNTTRGMGTTTLPWSFINAGRLNLISTGVQTGAFLVNSDGIEINAPVSGDFVEIKTQGTNRAQFKAETDGGIVFFEPLEMNDEIKIDGGNIIHAFDSAECGFAVTNEITSPGTKGTMQMPRTDDTTPTATELDAEFGGALGCHGLATLGGLPTTPLFVIKVGTSPSTWRGILLFNAGNTTAIEIT